MKQLLSIYTNWRFDVIILIAAVALILFFSEADTLMLFFVSKVLAFVLGLIAACLACLWADKLPEVDSLNE
jgi:cytochrome c oxidase assembly factor CtaG